MTIARFQLNRVAVAALLVAMNAATKSDAQDRSFAEDVEFLQAHVPTIVLGESSGPQVAVVPAYQGRVMTSTAGAGDSYGWINYPAVERGVDPSAAINVFGGEERFWLGPEGGQFSIFFAPGAPFDLSTWKTPAVIDSQAFEVVEQSANKVDIRQAADLVNYSRATLSFQVDRSVELIGESTAAGSLGVASEGVPFVGYRTTNRLTNTGDTAWSKASGLLSIWMLGMYKPGPETTVVIPFKSGSEAELGPVVNDAYFGKAPANRLKVTDERLFFSGDGQFRSKIGVSPARSLGVCGSYDAQNRVLTIVKYNQPPADVTDYVNSMWERQDHPYAGDAVNAYNDGPPEPGAPPLGPFFELETSSPAVALKPGESVTHISETYHFQGAADQLDPLARTLLGVSTDEISRALSD